MGGILAIVLWSTTFALARSLAERLGPVTAGAAVYVAGGAICVVRLAASRAAWQEYGRLSRAYLFGCGFLFVLYTVLLYVAVGAARTRSQLLEIALINYLWPAATILLSLPLLGQRAGRGLWPGTLIALAGMFLVLTHGTRLSWAGAVEGLRANPVPYALALVAALAWALYSNLARRWGTGGGRGAVELFIPATGVVLVGLRLTVVESAVWTGRSVAEAVGLGAVTVLAYGLWDRAMRCGDLVVVAACSYFTPLLSTVVSCVYLGVVPGSGLWMGTALLVVGSLASWRSVSPDDTPRGSEAQPR